MYIQIDALKGEADRLYNLVGKMYTVQDELKNISVRMSEDVGMQFSIPEIDFISADIDMECERIRKTARCLLYIIELCNRCNFRVSEILEDDADYCVEKYDWIENHIEKDVRLSLEEREEI